MLCALISRPQLWETKLLSEYRAKGDAPISGHMFTKGPTDYRNTASSYLSAALRTPSFWEHRFASIGSQVRESNPVSMMSIERWVITSNNNHNRSGSCWVFQE